MIKLISLITNILVLGEALALGIGMHWLSKGDNPWISIKNDLLLWIDVISSVALLYLTLVYKEFYIINLTYYIAGFLLFTHLFRTLEYLSEVKNKFCANVSLMVINNLKLIGLCVIILHGLFLKYQ